MIAKFEEVNCGKPNCAENAFASLWIVSERLPLGRYVYAIGANAEAARLSGIPVRGRRIAVYTISGLMAGIAAMDPAEMLRVWMPAMTGLEQMQDFFVKMSGGGRDK